MVYVKPATPKNPAQFKLPTILKGRVSEMPIEEVERMRNIARWHNTYGSNSSDRRDRQRHFAIAKAIENHYGQG